jgi:plastocyanin
MVRRRCLRPVLLSACAFTLLLHGADGLARPGFGGGVGGPASGAGVRPGAGWGAPGAGVTPRPGVGAGGVGGPASGAGVRPGAGWGAPGAGVRPGAGVGRPGPGVYGGGAWHASWAYGGYWAARPWAYGWYGTAPVAWGVAGMATAAAITSSVNAAAAQQSTVIVVPQTGYQLNYASVQAIAPDSVSFTWSSGAVTQAAIGQCRQGTLNGIPATAVNAHLLNAACVVAYGAGT